MGNRIFKEALEIAGRMDGCDPLWLAQKKIPDFKCVEGNRGRKPDIVLLHGLLGALSNWDATFPLLEKDANPIALQFPLLTGHPSEVKIKALAVYTWFFIRKRKIDPVALCGNSLGGHVAMRLYLASPESVSCLILSGTSGLYEHSVDTLPVRPDHRFIREHMGRVFKNPKFVNKKAIEEIYAVLSDRANVLNLIHAARSAKRDNMLDMLSEVKCPVLLLWGEDDEVTTMDVADTFLKHLPNAKLITIKNCGHAPMIEHPEWFAKEVHKFLKENLIS